MLFVFANEHSFILTDAIAIQLFDSYVCEIKVVCFEFHKVKKQFNMKVVSTETNLQRELFRWKWFHWRHNFGIT